MWVGENFEFLFLGDGQLHIGVTKSANLGFHVTDYAGTTMTVETGNTGVTMGGVFPGVNFGQWTKALCRVAEMAEFRF